MHGLCDKTLDKASTNKVARVFLHSALCADDHWIDKQFMATDVLTTVPLANRWIAVSSAGLSRFSYCAGCR